MKALTRCQREVLDFITEFIRARRYSPSLEEIAVHFGLSSVATVHKHVSNLEQKGYIKRWWNRGRSIEVITRGTWRIKCTGCDSQLVQIGVAIGTTEIVRAFTQAHWRCQGGVALVETPPTSALAAGGLT